jgi:hypothetical protein
LSLLTRTYRLRWTAPSENLREIARDLHEGIRKGVLAQVERGEPVLFVCCGVATPPGPTRLILEDRRSGLPGRAFYAVLGRDGSQIDLTIRSSRLRSLPLGLLDPLLGAVAAMTAPECPSWTVE